MECAPIPDDDGDRLAELAELRIIDAPRDEQLDRITAAAAQYFGSPISLVTLIDRDRQIVKSKVGLEMEQSGRDVSFCGHAILDDGPFVVADTRTDARFADNPLVTGPPHIGSYAGYPIKGPGGHRLGTLCVIDQQPRALSDAELTMLRVLAEAAQNRIAEITRTRLVGSRAQVLAAATNAAGIGLWEWDVRADVLTWDDKMYSIYGIHGSDFTGAYEAWAAGLHPDDAAEAQAAVQRALSGEKEYDTQFRVVWPGGDIHWIQAKATVTRDEHGEPLSMLGLNWDITTEKGMEAELALTSARDAERVFMGHIEAAISELPLVLYRAGWPENPGADRWVLGDPLRLLGVERTDFAAGRDLLSNVIPGERVDVERQAAQARARGLVSISQQFRVRGHDGIERWFQHVATFDDEACNQTGALLDIDTAKRLSLGLDESEKMEALGRLAGGVAHDFNNILGVISNFATLARDAAPADSEIRADINQIVAATERAGSITGQLLTVARPAAGLQPTDLNTRVTALTQFLSTAVGAGVELVVEPCDKRAMVLIDPAEIDRVIINLALNARDAMPGGGRLSIVVTRVGGQPDDPTPAARLTVSDTGVGMNPSTARRVFEPFFTTKDSGRGTGLGLFTSFGIITDAGGKIACSSVEGAGTTFTVDLPLLETEDGDIVDDSDGWVGEQPSNAAECHEAPAPSNQSRDRRESSILMVEDAPALRASTRRILEREGFAVTAAATIGAAREALLERDFGLLISDMGLPDGDGLDFVRELRAAHKDLPVVILTGKPTIAAASRAVHKGVAEFLVKPVAAADLIRVTRDAIAKGRQLHLRNRLFSRQAEGNEFLSDLSGVEESLADLARLEEAFETALSSLRMYFQPIVHASDSSIFGYEALLRCDGPTFASPDRLVAAAELLGRIDAVGLAVRSAVADVLSASPNHPHSIFVNLHPSEVRADVLGAGTEPLLPFASEIVLEITERAALGSDRSLEADLSHLRECGYRIAIDDLGEGYAGLSSLVRVNPDIVKIDISLVSNIDRTPLKQDIVSAIVGMARPHGIRVLAEGVETVAERATVRELGCDLLQGFLFAEPGPPFVKSRTTFDD